MNQDEQKELVHSLIAAVTKEIDDNFDTGRISVDWVLPITEWFPVSPQDVV